MMKSILILLFLLSLNLIQAAYSSEPQAFYINSKFNVDKTTQETADLNAYEINNNEMITLFAIKSEASNKMPKLIAKL